MAWFTQKQRGQITIGILPQVSSKLLISLSVSLEKDIEEGGDSKKDNFFILFT